MTKAFDGIKAGLEEAIAYQADTVNRLRALAHGATLMGADLELERKAADTIEAQAAEIERLRATIGAAIGWLQLDDDSEAWNVLHEALKPDSSTPATPSKEAEND